MVVTNEVVLLLVDEVSAANTGFLATESWESRFPRFPRQRVPADDLVLRLYSSYYCLAAAMTEGSDPRGHVTLPAVIHE